MKRGWKSGVTEEENGREWSGVKRRKEKRNKVK